MVGRRGFNHDCVPDGMVSLQSDGGKDQLESVSMGFLLANDIPRLLSCDDRDSQEQVSGKCQNGLLVVNGVRWEHKSCD